MEDKKLNIIYDTNVIVSSLLSTHRDSATVKALDYFYDKKVNLIYSDEIMTEYLDVLNRDKFGFNKNKIKELLSIIKKEGHKINPDKIGSYEFDMKDKPFYELVMNKDEFDKRLVTGNIKHYPRINKIIIPSELVNLVENKKEM